MELAAFKQLSFGGFCQHHKNESMGVVVKYIITNAIFLQTTNF